MSDVCGCLVPVSWVLCEAALDNSFELDGDFGPYLSGWRWILAQNEGERCQWCVAMKRPLTAEHFIQHNPQSENVRAGVNGQALGLFRRHIRKSPYNSPGLAPGSQRHSSRL